MDEVIKSEEKSKRRRGRRGKGGGGGGAGAGAGTTPTMPSAFQVLISEPQDDIISHNRTQIQVLREDHQEMLATRASLQQHLSVSHQHLRQLVATARKVKEDTDLQVKSVLERSIQVESQLGSIQALQSEHAQVLAHLRTLTHSNIHLHSQFTRLDSELHRIRMDAPEVADLKADLHALRLQLRKGRGAIEFEKKTRSANLQHYQEMDNKITDISNEIQRLRARLPPSNPALGYAGASDTLFRPSYSSNYPMHQATAPLPAAAGDATAPPTAGHHPFETRQAYLPTR